MSQKSVDTIHRLYELFAKGDIPAVLDMLDPNVEWVAADNSLYADGSPYKGPQAILDNVFMRIGADWDDFSIKVNEILDAGNKVIMLGTYSGTYKSTGKPLLAQVVHVWTLANERATKFQQYTDTKQFADTATA